MRGWISEEEDERARQTTVNLLVVIVCLLLIGAGLYLVESIHRASRIQNCFEAARKVCSVSPR
ncbi:hypothetical protein [uncultured Alsobacter sp.]|uniref:hypothetical protein n=1 Tax=uncultured Alsobacter sp. TaxID=1748258 RepID=UPI0025DF866C|nr:hypothetical protein [uncultured Alsobacter sp.]